MFFGTTAVIGIKAKQRERERETKKNNKGGCRGGGGKFFFFKDCFRTGEEEDGKGGGRWSAVEVGQVREAGWLGGWAEFRLYRLVASATLPPANQVRDKHEDDKEAECHAHGDGHQKAQIRVQEAFVG